MIGTIESVAFGGEGILRHDGLVIFVPFTAPGDRAEVEVYAKKKNFAHGKLLHLIDPSPLRTEPRCFYFGSCGGCQLQHMTYPAQVEAKRIFILDALKRIGKIEVSDLTVHPANEQWHYRRHIRLKLKKEKEGFNPETAVRDGKVMRGFDSESFPMGDTHSQKVKGSPIGNDSGSKDCVIPKMIQEPILGCVKAPAVEFPQVGLYYEHKTHLRESQPRGFDAAQDRFLNHFRYNLPSPTAVSGFKAGYTGCDPSQFINIAKCPIFIPSEEALLGTLEPLLANLSHEGVEEGSLRLIKANDEKFILAFSFSPRLPHNFQIAKEALSHNPSWQGIVAQSPDEKEVYGDVTCETEFLGLKARFSPFGFLQNHPEQSENLYRAILEALPQDATKILDLYCGIGITSLLFAKQKKKVWGVESHPETLALAIENATLNNLSVQFIEGKAETLGAQLIKTQKPDAVLCNPPRTGIDPDLLNALIAEKPSYILYVSCMPSTLARDLQKLIQAGYKIKLIQGFDMFPQTTHVETLVLCQA